MNIFKFPDLYFTSKHLQNTYLSLSIREIFFFDWTIESFGEIWNSKQFEMEYK